MSTRSDDPMVPSQARCAICGDADWRGAWHGHHLVCICYRCAIEVLPRLIADAVWRPGMRASEAEAPWSAARAEFWRAIALCGDRERHRAADDVRIDRLVQETIQ